VTYHWRVGVPYEGGLTEWSAVFSFTTVTPSVITSTSTEQEKKTHAFPNPFTVYTNIELQIDGPVKVSFEILNAQGLQIDQFDKHFLEAGKKLITWEGKTFGPGIYLCKISYMNKIEIIKLIREK
jgi:hypothetical protein